jgi:hypothetical protein
MSNFYTAITLKSGSQFYKKRNGETITGSIDNIPNHSLFVKGKLYAIVGSWTYSTIPTGGLYLNNKKLGDIIVNPDNTWSFDWTPTAADAVRNAKLRLILNGVEVDSKDVDVNDTPYVTIVNPSNNDIFGHNSSLTVQVEAIDVDGTISDVYVNANGTQYLASYVSGNIWEYTWTTPPTDTSNVEIFAVAVDNESGQGISNSIYVDILETSLLTTDQSTLATTNLSFYHTGRLKIDWGDGNIETITSGSWYNASHDYGSTGSYDVSIIGDYSSDLLYLTVMSQSHISMTTNQVAKLSNLQRLRTSSLANFTGDIDEFVVLTDLTDVRIDNSGVTGDILGFASSPNLNTLVLTNTSVDGDIVSLASIPAMRIFQASNTSISGNVSNISSLSNLFVFETSNTNILGDINSFSSISGIASIIAVNTSLTGDIGNLNSCPNLIYMYLTNTDVGYNTTTLPPWDCTILLINCGLTSVEVDDLLIDLANSGGTNGSVNLTGSNDAHTSASDSAITTLESNGWVVYVN